MELTELQQTVKSLEEKVAALENALQSQPKQTPPATPILADIIITPTSLRKAKRDIKQLLN